MPIIVKLEQLPLIKESYRYLPSKEEFDKIKELCSNFKIFDNLFIRIDFYNTINGIIFGEFTHPAEGKGYSKKIIKILDELMVKHDMKI